MLILPINKYNSFYSIDTKILLYLFVTLLGHRWSLRYLTRNDASGEIKWNEGSKNRQVSNFPVPVNHVEQDTFRASQISSHSRTPTTKTSWREHHRGIIIFAHKPPTWRPTSSLHSKLRNRHSESGYHLVNIQSQSKKLEKIIFSTAHAIIVKVNSKFPWARLA